MFKIMLALALVSSTPQLQHRTGPPPSPEEPCDTHMARSSHAFRIGAAKAAEAGQSPELVAEFLKISIRLEKLVASHNESYCDKKSLARLDIVEAQMIYLLSLYNVDPVNFK